MIGQTFADNCKLLGTTPNDFSLYTGVPKKTLGTWFHTKPLLLQRLFESYEFQQLRHKLSEFNNLKCSLRDSEGSLRDSEGSLECYLTDSKGYLECYLRDSKGYLECYVRDSKGYLEYFKARLRELESPRQAY